MTRIDRPRPSSPLCANVWFNVSDVSDVCCNGYICVAKVDRDVIHVVYFASVFKGIFQAFIQNI
jgi:hypothetical protein